MQVNATLTHEAWIRAYLTVWQGMLGFSQKEKDLLVLICQRHLQLLGEVRTPELLAELLLSASTRSQMRSLLAMSPNHFQNTLTSLKGKRALFQDELGHYHLSPKLIPERELTFTFTVHD